MKRVSNGDKEQTLKISFTPLGFFDETAKHFKPSPIDFIFNYRVENIEVLVGELRTTRVTNLNEIEESDDGKFIHLPDIEGNKLYF